MDTEYWSVIAAMMAIALTGIFVIGMIPVVVSAGLPADIESAPYSIYDYKINKFDCTEMSAIMEVHLSDHGHDSRILTLTRPKAQGHAMVIVYNHTENSCYYVECTGKRIVPELLSKYTLDGEYDDIVDVVENGRWGVGEWGLKLYLQEKAKI